jgi:hypothetical protein
MGCHGHRYWAFADRRSAEASAWSHPVQARQAAAGGGQRLAAEPVAALGHVIEVACVKVSVMGKHYASLRSAGLLLLTNGNGRKTIRLLSGDSIKLNLYRTVSRSGTRSTAVQFPTT